MTGKDVSRPIELRGLSIAHCPNCGADIHGKGMMNRCPVCDQKLDWSNRRYRINSMREMSSTINPVGSKYDIADMLVDTVEPCDGIYLKDSTGNSYNYNIGEQYMDGTIVNCFYHAESDCGFMVVECSEVYFEVYFNDYMSCIPKYFKDSTKLSGGAYW